MKLIKTRINLIQAQQIIIVNSEYILYTKKQFEGKITKIGQINYTIVYFFVCYNVKIEKKIKYHYCKYARMIKRIVQAEIKGNKISQSFFANQV